MTGGTGADSFAGNDGNDLMRADDSHADPAIIGGPGTDTAHYDLGLDPTPAAVENKIPVAPPPPPPPPPADSTPPSLRQPMTLDPPVVEKTDAGIPVFMTIHVLDEGSGVAGGTFKFSNGGSGFQTSLQPTSDPSVWTGRMLVDENAKLGRWTLTMLTLRDNAGNSVTLDEQWLASNGFAGGFDVVPTTQPDLTIALSNAVDVFSGGSASADLIIRVKNGLTGPITLNADVPSGGLVGFAIGPPYPTFDASVCWANGGECRIPFTVSVDASRWPRECYLQTYLEVYATAGSIQRYESYDIDINADKGDCS